MQQKLLTVRRWRRLRWLAPVLAVAFALVMVLPAFADTITNTTEPFSGSGVNPCNGEVITYSGEIHDVVHVTLDGSGGFHAVYKDNAHAAGVGSLGNKYEANGEESDEFNGKVGEEQTFPTDLLFVSQGSAPNYVAKLGFHITVNPDGTVTSFHEYLREECKG